MTATFHPSQRADRMTPRPIGGVHRHANYAVRRAVAAVLGVTVVASVAVAGSELLGALVDIGGRPAVASVGDGGDQAGVRIHVAQPGDTLWSIAERYRGDVGRGRFVDALIEVNDGTVIQIGQAVRLP